MFNCSAKLTSSRCVLTMYWIGGKHDHVIYGAAKLRPSRKTNINKLEFRDFTKNNNNNNKKRNFVT